MNFTVSPTARGCLLRTQPFSGLVRREWLRALAVRAENEATDLG